MKRRASARLLACMSVLLAGSCALPELTTDPDLEGESGESSGGTSGAPSGKGGSQAAGTSGDGGTGAGPTGGRAGTSSGDAGAESGGSTGDGGGSGKGGAAGSGSGTGGRGGATGGSSSGNGNGGTMAGSSGSSGESGSAGGSSGTGAQTGCTEDEDCASGETCCGTSCETTDSSVAHCGQCDNACGLDQSCRNGSCNGPCGEEFAVASGGWVTSPGESGCWRGYAYVVQNEASVTPATFEDCEDPCMLCIAGSVAGAEDYSSFVQIGVNLAQGSDGTELSPVIPTGSGLEIRFSNAASSVLRVLLQGPNGTTDPNDRWCADLSGTSPLFVPYSSFNTTCWDGQGAVYAGEPLEAIALSVPGAMDTTPLDFCLLGLTDRE